MTAIAPDTDPDTSEPESLIKKPEILKRTTFSDTTLWRRVRAGDFPAPVRISPNRVAWKASDVQAWMRSRRGQP